MPESLIGGSRRNTIIEDATGRLILTVIQDDAVEIIERLRETHVDVQGRAYLLCLDMLIERLGAKWAVKHDLVFDQLKANFERIFREPNWCIRVNDNCFLAVIPSLSEHKGALSVAELWYAIGQFFVGDVSKTTPPLFEALAEGVEQLRLIPIDLKKYFDRAEARPFRQAEAYLPTIRDDAAPRASVPVGSMTDIRRPSLAGAILNIGGRDLRVASAVEPVFEMKKLALIGHRFEPIVMEVVTNLPMEARTFAGLDWGGREQIDIANIEQGIKLLQMRSREQRKMLMVLPAAFSTFASSRARNRLMPIVIKASQDMGLKVLFEIRNLTGVPPGRTSEIAALLRPFCMTTMGQSAPEPRAIAALKGCGLSGVCIDFDGGRRDDTTLETYLTSLSTAARASTGACMIQGFDNLHQVAVARLAGISHASIKASALIASKA